MARDRTWQNITEYGGDKYACGWCGTKVKPELGYERHDPYVHSGMGGMMVTGRIGICPECDRPTVFLYGEQVPGVRLGNSVEHIPEDAKGVKALYEEARACTSHGAYTSAVLAARKVLMHVAVEKGAKEGETFAFYVDWLNNNGYLPKGSKEWVDKIRTIGNDTNHKIELREEEDAKNILLFTEMLLKLIYEYPGRHAKIEAKT